MFKEKWKNSENKEVATKLASFLYDCSQSEIAVESPFHYANMGDPCERKPSELSLSPDCFKEIPDKHKSKVGRWKLEKGVYEMNFPHIAITFSGKWTGCYSTYEFVSRPMYFNEETRDKTIEYLKSFDKKGFVFHPLKGLEKVSETVLSRMKSFQEACENGRPLSEILQDPVAMAGFSKGLEGIPLDVRKQLKLSKKFQYVTGGNFKYQGIVDFENDGVSFRNIKLRLPNWVTSADSFLAHFPFEIKEVDKSGLGGEIFTIGRMNFLGEAGKYILKKTEINMPDDFRWEHWIGQKGENGCSFNLPVENPQQIQSLLEIEQAANWLVKYEATYRNIFLTHRVFSKT